MSFGTNSPFGLKPVQAMAQVLNSQWTTFYIPNTGATFTGSVSLFTNDPLIQTNTGGINIAPAASGPIVGVFAGCSFIDSVTKLPVFRPYLLSGQTTIMGPIEVYVWTNTDMLYEIQIATSGDNNAAPAITTTMINSNARFNVATTSVPGTTFSYNAPYNTAQFNNPGAGNTNTGISGFYLDSATITAAQQTYPLTIVQLTPSIFNNIYSNTQGNVIFNTALVRLNTSYYTSVGGSSPGV